MLLVAASDVNVQLAFTANESAISGSFQGVGSIVMQTPSGSGTVFVDNAGRPTVAKVDGYTVVYSNWTGSTVDVALIAANGAVQIIPGVHLPAGVAARMEQSRGVFAAAAKPQAVIDWDLAAGIPPSEILSWGTAALEAAFCGAEIAAAFDSGGAATPIAIYGCTGAGLSILAAVTSADDPAIGASASMLSVVASGAGCFTGTAVLDCATFIAGAAQSVLTIALGAVLQDEEQLSATQSSLNSLSGDISITLTWDAAVDVDLLVQEPDQYWIWYQNPSLPSGGSLDHDITSGYGPETVSWPSGRAEAGTYRVYVGYYAGTGATHYSVQIHEFGYTKTYTGTLTSATGDTQIYLVTSFGARQALSNVVSLTGQGAPTMQIAAPSQLRAKRSHRIIGTRIESAADGHNRN